MLPREMPHRNLGDPRASFHHRSQKLRGHDPARGLKRQAADQQVPAEELEGAVDVPNAPGHAEQGERPELQKKLIHAPDAALGPAFSIAENAVLRFRGRGQPPQVLDRELAVRIRERDPGVFRVREAGGEGRSVAPVGDVHQAKAGQRAGELQHTLSRSVGAPVIDDEEFELVREIGQDAQGLSGETLQTVLLVVTGQEQGQGFKSAHMLVSMKLPLGLSVAYQLLLVLLLVSGASYYGSAGGPWPYLDTALRQWDAAHYLRIAQFGYQPDSHPTLIVFFPAYPMLVSLLSPVAGYLGAALTVTTIASIAGHALLFSYLRMLGYDQGRTLRIVGLVLLSPASIYFSTAYSEALYFLLTVCFLILLKQERFLAAAVCGAIAALTRNMGLLFVIPYLAACARSGSVTLGLRRAANSGVIALGTVVYLGLNHWLFQNPFAFSEYQARNWYKVAVNPFSKYVHSLINFWADRGAIGPGYELIYVDRLATFLFPLLCLMYVWHVQTLRAPENGATPSPTRMPPGFLLWAVAQYLVICSQSYWVSNMRYLALILPAYLMLEQLLTRRSSYALFALTSGALALWAVNQFLKMSWVF